MNNELSTIQYQHHRNLVKEIITEFSSKPEVNGILLIGSVARGDAHRNSDLDVYILVNEGVEKSFITEVRVGTLIEFKYASYSQVKLNFDNNHMELYSFLEGKIYLDKRGSLKSLVELSRSKYGSYQTSRKKKEKILHWLTSSHLKIENALSSNDLIKAIFLINTTTWAIYEGIWAVNDKPIPPSGSIFVYIKELNHLPQNIEHIINKMLLGNKKERVNSTIDLITWVKKNLEAPS